MPIEEALYEQIVLQQTPAAAPLEFAESSCIQQRVWLHGCCGQMARSAIISLILPIALVGFRLLGQTSTQFMMVWQRNRR